MPPKKEDLSVEELQAKLAEEQKKSEELQEQLKEALENEQKAKKAPRPGGVKYTKKAPEGDPGSDGKGNLFKYVSNDEVAKALEGDGWKKAA